MPALHVTQVKTTATDGYEAIQLGFHEVKEKRLTKPNHGATVDSASCYWKRANKMQGAPHFFMLIESYQKLCPLRGVFSIWILKHSRFHLIFLAVLFFVHSRPYM